MEHWSIEVMKENYNFYRFGSQYSITPLLLGPDLVAQTLVIEKLQMQKWALYLAAQIASRQVGPKLQGTLLRQNGLSPTMPKRLGLLR